MTTTFGSLQARSVTVIGLGAMGTALADAFLDADHTTTVWNRTRSKADALVARGARVAESIHDAVAASGLVVICISDYDAVRASLHSVDDLSHRTLFNVTSGTAADARVMASWTASRNGSYIDGAILDVTSAIGPDRTGTVFCSGSQDAWDEHKESLRALGSGVQYLGADAGLTGLYDVAALGVTWSTINGFLHAAALFEAVGQDPKSLLPLIETTLQNVSGWLSIYAEQIATGTYPPDGNIEAHLQAMENLVDESGKAGINTDLPRLLKSFATQAVAAGDGHEGYPAIIKQFRKPPSSTQSA